ncbi:MAG: hypothetical protein ACE5KT_09745, partial [Methanosarcinales archaeon]
MRLWNRLSRDEDWIHIKPSWNGESKEHLKLKLLAYKTLKYDCEYSEEQIKIEEQYLIQNGKEIKTLVPDLRVGNEIWVEVETLRGIKDPHDLIQEKFLHKKDEIKTFKEFWLVIPNFEISMHRKAIQSLANQLFNLFYKKVKVS